MFSSGPSGDGVDPSHERSRQVLLSRLLAAVRGCQARFGGGGVASASSSRGELATDASSSSGGGGGDCCREVSDLLSALEDVLSHGRRRPHSASAAAAVDRVRELLPVSLGGGSAAAASSSTTYWPFLKAFLSKHDLERFYLLRRVSTDLGRCRAWLRAALNEHSLERYLLAMVADRDSLDKFYEEWGFLRDAERGSMLPTAAAGLSSVTFALRIDLASLNSSDDAPPSYEVEGGDEDQMAVDKSASSVGGRRRRKKKKASNVVNLDQDDEEGTSPPDGALSPGEATPRASSEETESFVANHLPAKSRDHTPTALDFGEKVTLRPTATGGGKKASRQLFVKGGEEENDAFSQTSKEDARYDRILIKRVPANVTFIVSPFRSRLSIESEQDDAASAGADDSSGLGGGGGAGRLLTPLKNLSVGALIPVRGGGGDKEGTGHSSQQQPPDLNSEEDSLSMSESDYASAMGSVTPAQSKAGSIFGSSSRVSSRRPPASAGPAADPRQVHPAGSSVHSSSGISREDLKQALLSVMERKDELQSQCASLKHLLSQEGEAAAALKEEVAAEKRKGEEGREKLQSRIHALSRENELLKHQLKKYVGAVQKLRDGPQAYETLAQLEKGSGGGSGGGGGGGDGAPKYVDYHFEASEYEKKLIQVAEMHGELIEFNEHLQKTIQGKDALIRRMREELVDLRGPLAEGGAEEDPSAEATSADAAERASLSSTDSSSLAPLLHIWIPSVFLSGAGSKTHHVYQVYLRIKGEEWNIYRRYSDFHALHRELSRQEAAVAVFDFPPKKTVGYKAAAVVEERRKRLQAYLRRVANLMVQTNPSLAARPNRESVTSLLPFLAESSTVSSSSYSSRGGERQSNNRRSRSQGRSFFGRQQHQISSPQLAL